MTRSELVARLARENPHLSATQCDRLVSLLFEQIASHLVTGGRVELRGFGSFRTKARAPRIGVNPRNKTPVDLPKRRVPTFRAARTLIGRLNNWSRPA
jgi:integration host factor beta subunit